MPKNKALAIVPDDQLSLAIGKDGQNVRLAAKLTGWKIDVRSYETLDEEAYAKELHEAEAQEAGHTPAADGTKTGEAETVLAEDEKPAKDLKSDKIAKEAKTEGKPAKKASPSEIPQGAKKGEKKAKKTKKAEKEKE